MNKDVKYMIGWVFLTLLTILGIATAVHFRHEAFVPIFVMLSIITGLLDCAVFLAWLGWTL